MHLPEGPRRVYTGVCISQGTRRGIYWVSGRLLGCLGGSPGVSGRLSWGVWEAVLGVREGLGGCSRCPGGSRRVLGVYLGGS